MTMHGDHWQMFDVFKRDQLDNRILMNFQLTQNEPYACALQALGLWRPNLASGEQKEAATPVMITSSHDESEPSPPESTVPSSEQGTVGPSDHEDWVPLTSLNVEKGQKLPIYIKFPASKPKQLSNRRNNWIDILAKAVEYLVETGKLSADNCPIVKKNSSLPLLDKTNEKFRRSKQIRNDLWLNRAVKAPSSKTYTDRACWLLYEFDVSPSTVLVSTNRS